jgi:hypothetical protein
MTTPAYTLPQRFGIEPRAFVALARAMLLMDLRNQAYTRATATKSWHWTSPLFWVVGQCLTVSAVTSLVLFMRVDSFFYALAGLATSMLIIAATVVVEYHEIVLDPQDLEIIGVRPVTAATYVAARLANLVFYLVLMFLALNIFPTILGAALRDSSAYYVPAYLLAALAANSVTVALVIGVLSLGFSPQGLKTIKEFLAWTQIVAILVVGYGAQLMLRDRGHRLEVWAAFPPWWLDLLPPAWLARFVADASAARLLAIGPVLLGVTGASTAAILWRLIRLYRAMQGAYRPVRSRPMPEERLGGLATPLDWLWARGREERVGYWLGKTMLARDPDLLIRCLLPTNMAVAVVIVGLAAGQFADPLASDQVRLIVLPVLSVYLIALAVPPILYNLSFSRSYNAAWVLSTAPLEAPAGVALGMCKAVVLRVVMPLCVLWALVAAWVWRDVTSALLHAALAAGLSWILGLIALVLVVRDPPLSCRPVLGGSIGPIALPMAGFTSAMTLAVALHCRFGTSPLFWLIAGGACLVSEWPLRRLAAVRLSRLMEAHV